MKLLTTFSLFEIEKSPNSIGVYFFTVKGVIDHGLFVPQRFTAFNDSLLGLFFGKSRKGFWFCFKIYYFQKPK